jgi:hypothetical protein
MAASGERAKNIEKQSGKTSINNTKIRKNRGVVWQDNATNFLVDAFILFNPLSGSTLPLTSKIVRC